MKIPYSNYVNSILQHWNKYIYWSRYERVPLAHIFVIITALYTEDIVVGSLKIMEKNRGKKKIKDEVY